MPKRKPRDTQIPEDTFIRPIDINTFGNPETDPCYGKHYSLTAEECGSCGDHEVCAIAYGQLTEKRRLIEEKKVGSKDLTISALELKKDVKNFYDKKRTKGKKRMLSLSLTARRFNINIKKVKDLIL